MRHRPAAVACGTVVLAAVGWADAAEHQIEVKKAKLTEEPKSLSKPVAEVKYGEAVTVQQKQGDWWNVKPDGKAAGWITKSAVARTKTALEAGASGDTGVSESEQAAAYRPLSPEAEAAYRKESAASATGYAAVDKLDRNPACEVSDAQVKAFMKAGQLQQGGGQ